MPTTPAPLRITAAQLLDVARSMRGATETPPNSNQTIFGAAYGENGVPWCAMFVWWCFHQLGVDLRTLLTSKLEWTPTFAQACAAAGWRQILPGQQQPGDVVFFRFGSMIDHVAISTSANASMVDTIDGNTGTASDNNGGMVMERTRGLGVVAAIYRPPFAIVVAPIARPTLGRVLRYRGRWLPAMRGADVAQVQRLVGAVPDGVYGPQTANAVAVYEHKVRIAQDGEFGPQCCRAAGWVWTGK